MLNQTSAEFDTLASYCKATADQLRLLILRVLAKESFGVLELSQILGVAQPALSHHLKVLSNSGLVDTRRQGNSIYYRRAVIGAIDPIRSMRESLLASIDSITPGQDIQRAIEQVHKARTDRARQFFDRNFVSLKSNQDLIAEFNSYASCVTDLLDNMTVDVKRPVIEIGPGDSPLILELTRRFGPVVAIDNNGEMLQKTRDLLAMNQLEAEAFFEGELTAYQQAADLIVVNMVLHHIASPAVFFQDAYRSLRENGCLLIADLTSHDQAWTSDTCGDLWQGFDPEELEHWATAAHFHTGQSAYLGLKNGFQVQVRLFHKS